jgi:hypothetical protein
MKNKTHRKPALSLLRKPHIHNVFTAQQCVWGERRYDFVVVVVVAYCSTCRIFLRGNTNTSSN